MAPVTVRGEGRALPFVWGFGFFIPLCSKGPHPTPLAQGPPRCAQASQRVPEVSPCPSLGWGQHPPHLHVGFAHLYSSPNPNPSLSTANPHLIQWGRAFPMPPRPLCSPSPAPLPLPPKSPSFSSEHLPLPGTQQSLHGQPAGSAAERWRILLPTRITAEWESTRGIHTAGHWDGEGWSSRGTEQPSDPRGAGGPGCLPPGTNPQWGNATATAPPRAQLQPYSPPGGSL